MHHWLFLFPLPLIIIYIYLGYSELSPWHSPSPCLVLHPLELQASILSLAVFSQLMLDLDVYHGPSSREALGGLFCLVGPHWEHLALLRVSQLAEIPEGSIPPPLTPNRCPAYLLPCAEQ